MKKWNVLLAVVIIFVSFSIAQSQPVIGDWDGDGKDDTGHFNNGEWKLYINGAFETFLFGMRGDLPIVGDWNGDGRTKVGVYRVVGGKQRFYLDLNGNRIWEGSTVDKLIVIPSSGTPPAPNPPLPAPAPAPALTPPPTPPIDPIVYDPNIPTLTGMVPGTPNLGTMSAIAKGQVMKYYLNLPQKLDPLQDVFNRKAGKPEGVPYREGEVNVVDPNHIATFKVKITPEGPWGKPSVSEGLTLIKGKNIPAGRYLIEIQVDQIAPGYNSTQVVTSWGTTPPILQRELTR